jgi:fused signal recognition particle receptor
VSCTPIIVEASPEPAQKEAPAPAPEWAPASDGPLKPTPDPTYDVPPDPAPDPARDAPAAPTAEPAPDPAPRPGLMARVLGGAPGEARRKLDHDMLEELEELLIASDMGVETARAVTANIAEGRLGRALTGTEIKRLLAAEIARVHGACGPPLPIYPKKPQVVLVVGVNGSGKTTTIGKLASQFRAGGQEGGDRRRRYVPRRGGRTAAGLGRPRRGAGDDRSPRAPTRPALPSMRWPRPRPKARICC